jgi:hypothetical protein
MKKLPVTPVAVRAGDCAPEFVLTSPAFPEHKSRESDQCCLEEFEEWLDP